MSQNFNIHLATVIGLALNRKSHPMIEEIFNQNPSLYYETYLNSTMPQNPLKQIFSIETEDKINKLMGIAQVSLERQDYVLMERVIRAVFPPLVNYVKKQTVVDLDKFSTQYRLTELQENEMFTYLVSVCYLTHVKQKPLKSRLSIHFVYNKWDSFYQIMNEGITFQTSPLLPSELGESAQPFIKQGYQLFPSYSIQALQQQNQIVNTFISNAIEYRTLQDLGVETYWETPSIDILSQLSYEQARDAQFNEGIIRYIGSFSRYLNRLGLDSLDLLEDVTISHSDLLLMFKDFHDSVQINGANLEEYPLYVASTLFLHSFAKHYQSIKHHFLNTATEKQYLELKSLSMSLEAKQEELQTLEQTYAKTLEDNQQELTQLRKRLKELEGHNAQLEMKLQKEKQQTQEWEARYHTLDEMYQQTSHQLSQTQQHLIQAQTLSFEEKKAYVNQYRLGFFGGHSTSQQLTQLLDHIQFYNQLNEDISSIQGLDMVFINTDFMSHAFANKIKAMGDKLHIPTRYLSGTNLELLIEMMYAELSTLKN